MTSLFLYLYPWREISYEERKSMLPLAFPELTIHSFSTLIILRLNRYYFLQWNIPFRICTNLMPKNLRMISYKNTSIFQKYKIVWLRQVISAPVSRCLQRSYPAIPSLMSPRTLRLPMRCRSKWIWKREMSRYYYFVLDNAFYT